ncbi:unnamed protein product, partial [Porites lobata]
MNSKFVFLLLVAILVTASYASLLEEFDEAYGRLIIQRDSCPCPEEAQCGEVCTSKNRCKGTGRYLRRSLSADNMQLDISKIKLLIVYVVYVCVVPELKLPSAFSESGWLAYDGPRDEQHR